MNGPVTTLNNEMAAFDQLPPAVRKAMNEAVVPPLADKVLSAMRQGMTVAKALQVIVDADTRIHERDVADGDVAPVTHGRFHCERR